MAISMTSIDGGNGDSIVEYGPDNNLGQQWAERHRLLHCRFCNCASQQKYMASEPKPKTFIWSQQNSLWKKELNSQQTFKRKFPISKRGDKKKRGPLVFVLAWWFEAAHCDLLPGFSSQHGREMEDKWKMTRPMKLDSEDTIILICSLPFPCKFLFLYFGNQDRNMLICNTYMNWGWFRYVPDMFYSRLHSQFAI